ncbi:MAG: flavin monoamine oxidase family protein, partial [Pyrinomonadaceae bacterium]
VIIGAGAAGLAAAQQLSAAGLRIIVLEARDRIGGRIFTQKQESFPIPVELGAEFVHGKVKELFDIIEAGNLLLCDAADRHWHLRNGSLNKTGEYWERMNLLMQRLKQETTDRSFQDFLNSLHDDEQTRETKAIASLYVQGFHAASTDRIGIHGLNKANETAGKVDGDKQFRILSGYVGVADWLCKEAKSHNAVISLSSIAKELRWKRGKVDVNYVCEGGPHQISGRRLLVTVPLGVLQSTRDSAGAVNFTPPLPLEKYEAINQLATGQVAKITLQFDRRFWEELELPHEGKKESLWDLAFIHASGVAFPTWWTLSPLRVPRMVGWVGGPDAEKLLNHDE